MSQEKKALVERLMTAFNQGELSVIDQIVSQDFVGHNPLAPADLAGPQGLKGLFAAIRLAMPDARFPSWVIIAEDDLIVSHMALEGTFAHEFMRIPPNGRKLAVWMADIWRIEDGKIAEAWFNLDTLALMRQMDAV